ncbi:MULTISPECIES: YoaK family protein [unclassified Streptomyces]|uniref:YoaK family protein n=1 Tax=unclassified Streptomyces TaxID=2593676 RepID=UPI0022371E0E|nr:YoaK family protein [Streptomyces sp. SHP 1-2]MCW5252937.1 DUF1275 domain-containing protein [Streptomyces sp. SHP 1-2]
MPRFCGAAEEQGAKGPIGGRAVSLAALAAASGATDALCFIALGGVFASVMTGNLVFLGISAGRGAGALAAHAGVALAGYTLAVVLTSRFLGDGGSRRRNRAVFLGEATVMWTFVALWPVLHDHSDGGIQLSLLTLAAVAMGTQSEVVRTVAEPGVSTTYMTGLFTRVLNTLAMRQRIDWHRPGLLIAQVAGATCNAAVVATVPELGAALPALLVTLVALAGIGGG